MPELRKRLRDPDTRTRAAIEIGDWFRALCLLFGTEVRTAVKVGAVIAYGLVEEFEKQESEQVQP